MPFSLFSRKSGKPSYRGPAGMRAYAIGDVHGRQDLLADLLGRIEQDNAQRAPAKTFLIMLGDLIDRGPDSRAVVEQLADAPPSFATLISLKGNHEECLLDILSGKEEILPNWLIYGGYECAESYGVSKGWILNSSASSIRDRLIAQVPESHRQFLEQMADSFRFGDYLFVHAGIRPGVALDLQSGKDLRWIREGFLDDGSDHGMIVVHGHTIVGAPEELPNRIGIDTGAYRSGVLTALGIEEGERWFLQSRETADLAV